MEPLYTRRTVRILSADKVNELDLWVYKPTTPTSSTLPAVVMAHGFGIIKAAGLQSYAEPFATSGRIVVAFDFRCLGASAGTPRESIVIPKQRQDYQTVIEWAKQQDDVDASKIVIWGYSFAGGHSIVLGATYPGIAGIIAQSPFTSGISAAIHSSPISVLSLTIPMVWDSIAQFIPFLKRWYIPCVARRHGYGILTGQNAVDGFNVLIELSSHETEELTKISALGSKNLRVPASIVLDTIFYLPGSYASKVKIPMLVVLAKDDVINLPSDGLASSKKCATATVVQTTGGHFDGFRGGIAYEQSLESQLEFLDKVVPL